MKTQPADGGFAAWLAVTKNLKSTRSDGVLALVDKDAAGGDSQGRIIILVAKPVSHSAKLAFPQRALRPPLCEVIQVFGCLLSLLCEGDVVVAADAAGAHSIPDRPG